MRFRVSSVVGNSTVRFLVLALLAGTATGCSSDVTRFGGVFASRSSGQDTMTTASIPHYANAVNGQVPIPERDVAGSVSRPNQPIRSAANEALSQPFPQSPNVTRNTSPNFNTNVSGARIAATPQRIDRVALAAPNQGKITNSIAKPVTDTLTEKKQALAQAFPDAKTVTTKRDQLASATDTMITGKTSSGWTTVNAPAVRLQQGESVAALAKRYGVPEKEILKANGLASPGAAQAGQTIIIPVFSTKSAAANVLTTPTTGAASIVADKTSKIPVPAKAPGQGQGQAILPATVALRDKNGKVISDQKLATAAPAKAGQGTPSSYQVQPGDSLAKIAKKTGVPIDSLKSANGIVDKPIRVGQTLTLPNANAPAKNQTASIPAKAQTTASGAKGQTASAAPVPATAATAKPANAKAIPSKVVATNNLEPDNIKTGTVPAGKETAAATKPVASKAPVTANESVTEAAAKNDPNDVAPEGTGIGKYRWPVRGAVIAGYGSNVDGNRNDGIDISVPQGTPVKAAENGVVIYSGNGLKELGNTVLIRHDDGTVTVYGNADKLNVTRGEKVTRGQVIANSGMSGNASRPKLHFEVRKNASAVNPMTFLD